MPGFISVLIAGSRFSSSKRSEILAQVKVKATVNQKKCYTQGVAKAKLCHEINKKG
jgi:uncharacterized membrane protein